MPITPRSRAPDRVISSAGKRIRSPGTEPGDAGRVTADAVRAGTAVAAAEPAADSASPRERAIARTLARLPRVSDPLLAAATALAVVAAACAGWFGWSWHGAASSSAFSYAHTRDAVLQAGEQAIQNLNTLDYRHVDQGFGLWLDSSVGNLHSYLMAGRGQFEQAIRQAKTVTTAQILEGSVTSLDVRAGTASIIAAVQITVTPASGSPAVKRIRLAGQLTRTSAGWKLSQLTYVPVGTGSAGARSTPGP